MDLIDYEIDEDSILCQFPNTRLHEIKNNRICLSASQLENILDLADKKFNECLINLFKIKLQNKNYKSLDFYDVFNLVNIALKTKNKDIQDPNKRFGIQLKNDDDLIFIQKEKKRKEEKNEEVMNSSIFTFKNKSFMDELEKKIEKESKKFKKDEEEEGYSINKRFENIEKEIQHVIFDFQEAFFHNEKKFKDFENDVKEKFKKIEKKLTNLAKDQIEKNEEIEQIKFLLGNLSDFEAFKLRVKEIEKWIKEKENGKIEGKKK